MTPWQKVFSRIGMTQSQLARALGRHRSKVSRHLTDEKGLISGRDQEKLMKIAQEMKLPLRPSDMLPG